MPSANKPSSRYSARPSTTSRVSSSITIRSVPSQRNATAIPPLKLPGALPRSETYELTTPKKTDIAFRTSSVIVSSFSPRAYSSNPLSPRCGSSSCSPRGPTPPGSPRQYHQSSAPAPVVARRVETISDKQPLLATVNSQVISTQSFRMSPYPSGGSHPSTPRAVVRGSHTRKRDSIGSADSSRSYYSDSYSLSSYSFYASDESTSDEIWGTDGIKDPKGIDTGPPYLKRKIPALHLDRLFESENEPLPC